MAVNFARNMFCRPGSRNASLIFCDNIYRIQLLLVAKCILLFGGGGFKGYFVFIGGNLWDCAMWVCIWNWVGEGIPC